MEAKPLPSPTGFSLEPGGDQWLFTLERKAILPVKWLISLLCAAMLIIRSPDHLPTETEFGLFIFYLISNLVFSYLLYLNRIGLRHIRSFSLASFTVDVAVMAGFIFLTGGIDSDFYILFFLVILRGLGFFPTARMNILANVVVGLIYISAILLVGFEGSLGSYQDFYQKILMVVGVVLLSWFIIGIQLQQRQALEEVNRSLLAEGAYVQSLLESISNGVVAFDFGMHLTVVNAAARQILQLPEVASPEQLKQQLAKPILHACEAYIQSGQLMTDQPVDLYLPDGESKTVRLTTRVIRSSELPEGEGVGVVAVFEDVSTVRKMEEQLWQSEKLASVGQLAAGVAHELGNPIGIIKSCADYMSKSLQKVEEESPLKKKIIEEVEVIASESERCQRILRELLSYSAAEAVAMENLDAGETLRRAIALVAYHCPEDRIQLRNEVTEDPLWVKGDPNLLTQALVNILLNAIQAIEDTGSVTVRAAGTGKHQVAIEIEDTGKGIPPESLKRIFDPFFTTRDDGTGLGLAITQRMIGRMEGSIEVQSTPGKGSLFRVLLKAGHPVT